MKIDIKECVEDDLTILHELSYNTYNDTFKHLNS